MAGKDSKKDLKHLTAVALAYERGETAPRVVASGKGLVAQRIIETAQENDVPLHEDSKLAETLSNLEIGEMIPPELYEVVAEVLVFVNDMEKIRSKIEAR